MMGAPAAIASYRPPMRRLFWLPLSLSAVVVLAVLCGLVAVSWRSLDRLQPIQKHLSHIARIQDVGLTMEQTLISGLQGLRVDPEELAKLHRSVEEIAALEGAMHPQTADRLRLIAQRLDEQNPDPIGLLFETLASLREVLDGERERHDWLVMNVARDTRMELRMATALLIVLPLGGVAALVLLRRRVQQPLRDLEDLLMRLAGREYQPVSDDVLAGTAKLAQPAFQSYNALVWRLQELEMEHQDREHTLEQRVRQATEALLAQSRELARAERLAAVGAVSAGLAHELRNPLAGIQMACSKLARTLGDGDQAARIHAVIAELKRINDLLTEQVSAARHAPEPFTTVEVAKLVDEMLVLLRYQIPSEIVLETRIDPDVVCLLPAAALRQALLNVLLNAVQVLGDSGRVAVTAERNGGEVVIEVSDDGPGFPEKMLRAGIRPFATGRAGGTGLGLAMVRRFVRDHNGDLALSNRQPRGASVMLRLPCRTAGSDGEQSHA